MKEREREKNATKVIINRLFDSSFFVTLYIVYYCDKVLKKITINFLKEDLRSN